ncbi:hypothetical protein [Aphanothece sacrum]|uniref:Uncharacterized protein n=1 Tax=Aphanothece sacrum FPU1 TaxID=1920663 RepID=A0A401IK07_APHSA|nr:hypothetical protein [Aphanothece sacrum]GBF81510.1 hypothetical protein AsFPU1_2924 [Aphanothece sacrum FPU1]GBF86468.1 hypothetical protein AsFPU3_3539 [Aphanothece sacrum FPU3]
MMKIIQSTGKIDTEGRLSLDHPIPGSFPSSVRVIVLFEEMEAEVEQISEGQQPIAMTPEKLQYELKQALTEAGYDSREKIIQLVQDVKQEIFQERQQNRK